jgi:hypothetical protein
MKYKKKNLMIQIDSLMFDKFLKSFRKVIQ